MNFVTGCASNGTPADRHCVAFLASDELSSDNRFQATSDSRPLVDGVELHFKYIRLVMFRTMELENNNHKTVIIISVVFFCELRFVAQACATLNAIVY